MSKHYQIETNMSLTGANADKRIQIKPSEQGYLISSLLDGISGKSFDKRLTKIVSALKSNKEKSIVVSNSNEKNIQLIVNAINNKLGNYGNTIHIDKPSYLKQGNSGNMDNLIKDMSSGKVGALITYQVNPSYNLHNSNEFNSALSNVDLKISTSNVVSLSFDKMDGVKFDDCFKITKFIEDHFDRDIEDYELNVSSAGIDNPFKVEQQYIKNIGNLVNVLLINGKRKSGAKLRK